jgi:hypothetical protein
VGRQNPTEWARYHNTRLSLTSIARFAQPLPLSQIHRQKSHANSASVGFRNTEKIDKSGLMNKLPAYGTD